MERTKAVRTAKALDENSDSNDEDFTHDRLMDEDIEYRSKHMQLC